MYNVTVSQLVGLSQLKGDKRVGRLTTTVRAERVCEVGARDVAGLKRISRGMPGSGKFPNHFSCAQSGERCGTMSDWKVRKGREG